MIKGPKQELHGRIVEVRRGIIYPAKQLAKLSTSRGEVISILDYVMVVGGGALAEAALIERGKEENPMRMLRIEKVVVNSCIWAAGVRLEKAAKILEMLTGQKPEFRKAKKTIKGFGIYGGSRSR